MKRFMRASRKTAKSRIWTRLAPKLASQIDRSHSVLNWKAWAIIIINSSSICSSNIINPFIFKLVQVARCHYHQEGRVYCKLDNRRKYRLWIEIIRARSLFKFNRKQTKPSSSKVTIKRISPFSTIKPFYCRRQHHTNNPSRARFKCKIQT